MRLNRCSILVACLLAGSSLRAWSQKPLPVPQKVILDTDIGDDIDDAYALALVLSSPEVKLLGVTTAWATQVCELALWKEFYARRDSKAFL